jgi:hypothetical protein
MDDYQFISSVINSLAWPFFIFLIFWTFRVQIAQLLPFLRLKYKDIDITFRLDEAVKEAADIPATDQVPQPTREESDKFRRLIKISPSSAIAEKARDVEQALGDFGEAVGMTSPRTRGWLSWTRELRKYELIDSATSALLEDLRFVRNAAVHSGRNEITENDAYRFIGLADKLIASLQMSTAAAIAANKKIDQPTSLNP